ncbi:uncharacterized protein Tco025E_00316 [Trypanosoma conorhini]|uniref:Uncharacterized protein n=1 Tax=Trypanosoma conorhini TaxID=83891 RepID=A0A3R7PM62_9TRYP|nr:uncharacterized protein Tco025E_00316 [Trypanosoma conorhini]RNF27454.1 hypothetical protein Tco025E_00316 [Trypanosoma conorhini]
MFGVMECLGTQRRASPRAAALNSTRPTVVANTTNEPADPSFSNCNGAPAATAGVRYTRICSRTGGRQGFCQPDWQGRNSRTCAYRNPPCPGEDFQNGGDFQL